MSFQWQAYTNAGFTDSDRVTWDAPPPRLPVHPVGRYEAPLPRVHGLPQLPQPTEWEVSSPTNFIKIPSYQNEQYNPFRPLVLCQDPVQHETVQPCIGSPTGHVAGNPIGVGRVLRDKYPGIQMPSQEACYIPLHPSPSPSPFSRISPRLSPTPSPFSHIPPRLSPTPPPFSHIPPRLSPTPSPFSRIPPRLSPTPPPFSRIPPRLSPTPPPFSRIPLRLSPTPPPGFNHATPPPPFHQTTSREKFTPDYKCLNRDFHNPPPPPPPHLFYAADPFHDPVTEPLSQRQEFQGTQQKWKRTKRGGKKNKKANDARRSATHLPVAPLPVAPLPVTQAEGQQFVCEACSKEYKLEETYQAHISAHKKCSTCDFMAVPSVLKEHELLHILPPELNFSSPEDIKSWREKRKRNYPTAANIAKKRKLETDRQARGEVAQTPLYKYVSHLIGEEVVPGGGGGGGRGRGWGGRGRGQWRRGKESGQRWRGGKKKWRGIRQQTTFKQCGHGDINSGEDTQEQGEDGGTVDTSSPQEDVSQGSKEAEHPEQEDTGEGRSSEGIIEAIMADVAPQTTLTQTSGKRKKNRKRGSRGGMRRFERSKWNKKKKQQQQWVVLSEVGERKQPTLLEKLLAPEIRKEHNAILQCIRYTVQEGFFMPPVSSDESRAAAGGGDAPHKEVEEQDAVIGSSVCIKKESPSTEDWEGGGFVTESRHRWKELERLKEPSWR